jgi:type I restriction enzyme, R subunit
MPPLNEDTVESVTLEWFAELGYHTLHGDIIAPDRGEKSERVSFGDVVLVGRLQKALERLNPHLPVEAREEVLRVVRRVESADPVANNRRFHRFLTDGVPVEYVAPDGRTVAGLASLIDFDHPARNDWLAVNQFTVIEHGRNRRPDVVVFVNGLPLVVIELKNAAAEKATIRGAFNQIQTYKHDIPGLFVFNALCIISDGIEARAGTMTADWERFMPWRTIDGNDLAPRGSLELEVLLRGMFDQRRFLELVRYFIVFEDAGSSVTKKLAAYHQFHAVQHAVEKTRQAAADGRIGIIWHTQGSGKSLTMAFYAGRLVQDAALHNPTLVVLTDRNDLDDQLFGTFARCAELLRQTPMQAEDRQDLRERLRVASGGVIFTTIQKFLPDQKGNAHPLLSNRDNIVVIADEAHRTQYDLLDGFGRHLRDALPRARFIAFTGTPIEAADRSTKRIFGDYIDTYDIQQAVEDGATVPIYYEARQAKLALDEAERPRIDPEFEDITEGEEEFRKEALKSRWSRLEAVVGAEQRISLLAADIVQHFEQRQSALIGKGMIVCMSRRICVALYDAIVALRPDWHSDDDATGQIKVVMTGSAADPQVFQPHVRNKQRREVLAERLKNPDDPLKLVIVRDMWLTGFDAPSLHTLYVDKPMRGHGLMQAIARVNRVFRDKPGGLVVDYIGLSEQLRGALAEYTDGARQNTGISQEQALAVMQDKLNAVIALFAGFDYHRYLTGTAAERLRLIPQAMEHILSQSDGKARLIQAVTELSKAFALVIPHPDALQERDLVAFFQTLRAAFVKNTSGGNQAEEDLDSAVQGIVAEAVASDAVVDVFAALGLNKPNIAILSDEFLNEVRHIPQRNLALELLQKLLHDQIRVQARHNLTQARSFAVLLEQAVRAYQNRTLETAQVLSELMALAHELRAAQARGDALGLNASELAFYDALRLQSDAVQALDDASLSLIAREVVKAIRGNTSLDWTQKDNMRAKLRSVVKRVLNQYGYPPELRDKATLSILEQAEAMVNNVAA